MVRRVRDVVVRRVGDVDNRERWWMVSYLPTLARETRESISCSEKKLIKINRVELHVLFTVLGAWGQ